MELADDFVRPANGGLTEDNDGDTSDGPKLASRSKVRRYRCSGRDPEIDGGR